MKINNQKLKIVSLCFCLLVPRLVFSNNQSSLESQITSQRLKLRKDELKGLSKKDSLFERKAIEVEEKLYEFTYNLKVNYCPSKFPEDEKICNKSDADLVLSRDLRTCLIKAEQLWHQAAFSESFFADYPHFFGSQEYQTERLEAWRKNNSCNDVLAVEQKNISEVVEKLKEGPNYVPETCKWVSDLPRKMINIPGCADKDGKTKQNNMCTGYVVCDQKDKFGSGKFIRMATCRKQFCLDGDQNAKDCVAQKNYSSYRPQDLDSESVSDFILMNLQSE